MATVAGVSAFRRTFADPAGARNAMSYQAKVEWYNYLGSLYDNSIYDDYASGRRTKPIFAYIATSAVSTTHVAGW